MKNVIKVVGCLGIFVAGMLFGQSSRGKVINENIMAKLDEIKKQISGKETAEEKVDNEE